MVRPFKRHQIANLREAIKDTAWKQIAEFGAAALSLRAIGRELNITAPAIYNYYPDRDALVTALIIDAFTSFGDHQIQARDQFPKERTLDRFLATGVAYREWAIQNPQRYQLIFGTPIPNFKLAPMEVSPAPARSISALVSVVDDLRIAGKLKADNFPIVKVGKVAFSLWQSVAGNYDILSLSVAMLIWSRVHGLVSLEISGKLPPFGENGDELYRYELESIRNQFVRD